MIKTIIYLLFFINQVIGYGWVPLIDLKTYNTKKPSELKVFDKTFVIWEKENEIIVQDNACKHRLAPLSEGYIDKDSGNLRCSYHGWEFNSKGDVISIPQSCKPNCNLKQNTYHTKICNNMLWLNLNETSIEFPSHISDYNDTVSNDVVVVEIPYNMNILLENLFDPAHVPFAHHKLQSTRDLASSVNSTVTFMNETGIQFIFEDNTLQNKEYRNGSMTFYAPCHYVLENIFPQTFLPSLHVYCVPILPDQTRIFVQYEYSEGTFKFVYSRLPSWFKHVISQAFFDSDTMLLYRQEQILKEKNILDNCTYAYSTPTSSDYSIHMFHKWRRKYPQIWSSKVNEFKTPLTLSRHQVFDRYNRHTKHCTECKKTLTDIETMQKIIPITLLLMSIAQNNIYEGIIGVVVYFILREMKTYFVYRDYIHNEL